MYRDRSFQAFHVYGGGRRLPGAGGAGVSAGAAGLTYADSVRYRSAFEAVGRPLRPNYQRQQHHHYHHHHHPQVQRQQQQFEGAGVVDTRCPCTEDIKSTVDRIRCLQAELDSRDSVVHGPTNNNELVARKDKVRDHRDVCLVLYS